MFLKLGRPRSAKRYFCFCSIAYMVFGALAAMAPNKVRSLPKELPDELILHVLVRLPSETLCRARCACSLWKRLVAAVVDDQVKKSCIIRVIPGCSELSFFSHSKSKWLQLPRPNSSSNANWEVADVDAGLILYESIQEDRLCLGVSDPLMQNFEVIPWSCSDKPNFQTNSSNLLPSDHLEACRNRASCYRVKLWVDRQEQTFRVILLSGTEGSTWAFESIAGIWDRFDCQHGHFFDVADGGNYRPRYRLDNVDIFDWKSIIYYYNNDMAENCFVALDMELKKLQKVKVEFPDQTTRYEPCRVKIIHSKDQLLLVQVFSGKLMEKIFSVWKLRDSAPSSVQDFSLSNWVEITTGSNMCMAIENLAYLSTRKICYGDGYVFFLLDGYTVSLVSGRKYHVATTRCVRYTIVSRIWCEFPCPPGLMSFCDLYTCKLYTWEPSQDMESKLSVEGF